VETKQYMKASSYGYYAICTQHINVNVCCSQQVQLLVTGFPMFFDLLSQSFSVGCHYFHFRLIFASNNSKYKAATLKSGGALYKLPKKGGAAAPLVGAPLHCAWISPWDHVKQFSTSKLDSAHRILQFHWRTGQLAANPRDLNKELTQTLWQSDSKQVKN